MGSSSTERGTWTGKLDFLLSCLGYAVGLGNVWRFPYLCFKNGGGAFLVPYAVMLLTVGIPVFLIELTIGQYSAKAPITLFRHLTPIFTGLGYCIFIAGAVVGIYYNMIIGWSIHYLFASFTSELPWQKCDHDYNTGRCFSDVEYDACKEIEGTYNFGQCFNSTEATARNLSDIGKHERISAAEEYLNKYVLGLDEDISLGNLGRIQWSLALSTLASWILVCASLIKGIKTSGKVVYFTALFPYVILTILLIKGAMLPGAADGIKFYLVPDWEKVKDPNVWKDAAIQIFFSLSIASGGLITLASYNKFDNNLVRDTMIVCFGNCLTSVYAGFAIFSILGYMAHNLGVTVAEVANSGSGLAFVAYPTAIQTMWCPPLWAILFFLMLLTLGLDTMFATVENATSSIIDEYPKLNKHKHWVVIATCAVGFLLNLPLCCQGGRYLLDLLDNYGAGWPFLFVGLCECLMVAYFYGIDCFFDDLSQMLRKSLHWFVEHHLAVLFLTGTPLILLVLLVLSFVEFEPPTSGDYEYPVWGHAIGWATAMVPIAIVPLVAIYMCITSEHRSSSVAAWKALTSPTDAWRDNALDFARESIHTVPTELSTVSMMSMIQGYSSAAPHPYPYDQQTAVTQGKKYSRTANEQQTLNGYTNGSFDLGKLDPAPAFIAGSYQHETMNGNGIRRN